MTWELRLTHVPSAWKMTKYSSIGCREAAPIVQEAVEETRALTSWRTVPWENHAVW
jgi:hypothetical protein